MGIKLNIFDDFDNQTMAVSVSSGILFSLGWWIVLYTMVVPNSSLGFLYILPPFLATLFILPLFMFSINLITDKDGGGFGEDETRFRKKLLFALMGLQFIPVLASMGLMISKVNDNQNLRAVQFIANILMLMATLVLKLGNYKSSEEDSF